MANMKKFLDLQANMRNEQQDLGKYTRDLLNWSGQIKEKDEFLRKQESVEDKTWLEPRKETPHPGYGKIDGSKNSPRKSDSTPKPETPNKSYVKTTPAPRSQADWDKFNVDEALEEVENEHVVEKEEPVSLIKQKEKLALEKKVAGNEFLKLGEFEKSLSEYTEGMNLDPAIPEIPANRGWAYFKLGRYPEAEQDFSLALTLNPTYQKVIKRRAKVRIVIGKVSSAENDLKRALKLDSKDKEAKQMLEKLLNPSKPVKKLSVGDVIKPIKKPVNVDLESYAMTNIAIDFEKETVKVAPKKNEQKKKVAEVVEGKIETQTKRNLWDIPMHCPKELQRESSQENISVSKPESKPEPKPEPALKSKPEIKQEISKKSIPTPKIQKIITPASLKPTKNLPIPNQPKTTSEFLFAIESLSQNYQPVDTATYLLKIENINKFLNDQIEAEHAVTIIISFLSVDVSSEAKQFLTTFSKLDRLDMLMMMHDEEEDIEKIEQVEEKFGVKFL
jgi:tetratricopeptide (TPR) repeat protein